MDKRQFLIIGAGKIWQPHVEQKDQNISSHHIQKKIKNKNGLKN